MVPLLRVSCQGCVTPLLEGLLLMISALRRNCLICSLVSGVSSGNCPYCTPRPRGETTPIAAWKLSFCGRFFFTLPHRRIILSPRVPSLCGAVETQVLFQHGGCNEGLHYFTFLSACRSGICCHVCGRQSG